VNVIRPGSQTPWRGNAEQADFFTLKGVIEVLARSLVAASGANVQRSTQEGVAMDVSVGGEPFLHPARAVSVSFGGVHAGWLGELHPAVAAAWDLPSATAFELDVAPLLAVARTGDEVYEDLLTHPALLQDLAVVVPDDVSAETVRAAVLDAGGELLRSAEIFDLYRGAQVGEGRKSLALRLEFRAADRTLTDEEVTGIRSAIADSLEAIGGSIRA